jgi:hypothetical protein
MPDIGYVPISGIPDIGTNIRVGIYRYRDQMSRYPVIEFPDIAYYVSCSQQAGPLAQGWPGGWLSGCCRLLVIARESFIQCKELYLIFPAAAAAPAAPGPPAPAAAAAAPPLASCGGGVDGGGELVNAWLCTMSSSAMLA